MVLGLKFGKFWLVVGGCGLLWVVLDGCGWLCLVLAGCGCFWLVLRFSMYALMETLALLI